VIIVVCDGVGEGFVGCRSVRGEFSDFECSLAKSLKSKNEGVEANLSLVIHNLL
jgi:hypothetical protein